MKKYLLLLFIGLLMFVVAACSEDDENGSGNESEDTALQNFNLTNYPIVDEEITLEMMGMHAASHGPWEEMRLFMEMNELTNISWDFKTTIDESFEERKNLAFASLELPDVFFNARLTATEEMTYGREGVLVPLNDLIDQYAPNIKRVLEENPDVKASITTPDGNIYALPKIKTLKRNLTPRLWINGVWINNLGLEMPETTEDLYEVLKAFKEQDPNGNGEADEIPLTSIYELTETREAMLSHFGLFGTNQYNVIEDEVVFYPIHENYLEYIKYMNRLWEEGLIDQDAYSQTHEEVVAKGQSMRLGLFVHSGPQALVPEENTTDYPALPPLTSSVNDQKVWPRSSVIDRGAFAITSENPHPEASIRWVDYLYSEEGSILVANGVEDIDYKWNDDGTWTTDGIIPEDMRSAEYMCGQVTPNCGSPNIPYIENLDFHLKEENELADFLNIEVEEKYADFMVSPYPDIYFTEEQQDRISELQLDIDTYLEQMEARFITGVEPFTSWDDYVDTIENLGIDEIIKIYQEGYDTWKSNL